MRILTAWQETELSNAIRAYQKIKGEPLPRVRTILKLLLSEGFDPDKYKIFIDMTRIPILGTGEDILERLFGFVSEVGEVFDILQKAARHGEAVDKDRLTDELGDVFYYFMSILDLHDVTLSEVINTNLNKLCDRQGIDKDPWLHPKDQKSSNK